MTFKPQEIIFSPTSICNLSCAICTVKRHKRPLDTKIAVQFLNSSKRSGVKKIGISGGEPFLYPEFLYKILENANKNGILLNRIMTNGVWFKDSKKLNHVLEKLLNLGFLGEICLSVDMFHKQDLNKLALFIKTAVDTFKRKDVISIAYVSGAKDKQTLNTLSRLSKMLNTRICHFGKSHAFIRSKSLFIKLVKIELSPIGKAGVLKNPWDGKWFKEDHCKGPGNVFFIMANGDVSSCCGYANEESLLRIGNIYRDTSSSLIRNANNNLFIKAVFNKGLSSIRKKLTRLGIKFPGKTSSHCYFCWYIQNFILRATLIKAL